MRPMVLMIGADKGGVGKTTVARALMGYLEINNRGDLTRAYDTEPDPGVLKRFHPGKTEIVDFTTSAGVMRVLDTMTTSPITVLDTKAGILSDTLQMFENIGTLDMAKNGLITLAVMHVLGGNVASFEEIKKTAEKLTHARHFMVKNQINDNSFFKWNSEMSKFLAGGVIEVPKLDALAGEHVDADGAGFEEFCKVGRPNTSPTLQGFVRFWKVKVYQQFDIAGLNAL
jgi:hypothetical protein